MKNSTEIPIESLRDKKMLIVSYWGYPIFGGGEQFLYDSMKWCYEYGMNVTWLCFADANPQSDFHHGYEKMNVIKVPYGLIIQVPGGFIEDNLKNWIRLINPDIVHHQGLRRFEIVKACNEIDVKVITGACFWNDVIELNSMMGNMEILKYHYLHKKAEKFDIIKKNATIIYSASHFVSDVIHKICGVRLPDVVYSSSLKEHCLLKEDDKLSQSYAVVINCHKLKGGELVLKLMQSLPQIPFYVVRTEYGSEELDKQIEDEIAERNKNTEGLKSQIVGRFANIKDVLRYAKVFLATSLVDETFCKTVNEAMANGIPVVTTGRGNIAYMLGTSGTIIPPSNVDKWIESINKLFTDEEYYDHMSQKIRAQYSHVSEEVASNQFNFVLNKALFDIPDKSRNVMLFVPWCDQGLGIQARSYVELFKHIGYDSHIFSYNPYFATESNPKFQANEDEWKHPSIYYSPNSRENVTDDEIISFIKHNNIGLLIIPETCFDRVYQVAAIAKNMKVKTFCIPNIEIVRQSEFPQYVNFDKILCNNKLCESIFNQNGFYNTPLIEYTPIHPKLKFKRKTFNADCITFLALGGLNSIVRKQIVPICQAFNIAHKRASNIKLCVSIQGSQIPPEISNFFGMEHIEIIVRHQSYEDILRMYQTHNVNIQVSKHEGLGLGFYESIATGTPVITLDTPPHNELIIHKTNGWLIKCTHEDMKDNTDGLVQSALFDPEDLADQIVSLANDISQLKQVTKNTRRNFIERFNVDLIGKRFFEAFIN